MMRPSINIWRHGKGWGNVRAMARQGIGQGMGRPSSCLTGACRKLRSVSYMTSPQNGVHIIFIMLFCILAVELYVGYYTL